MNQLSVCPVSDGQMQEVAVQTNSYLVFEAFGVQVRLIADDEKLLRLGWEVAKTALVERLSIVEGRRNEIDHTFGVHRDIDGKLSFTNEGVHSGSFEREVDFRRTFNSMIRVHVAEKARGWVFIHAGVVGWRGRAILLPAMSRNGKTTLVSELIRLGADYYSDEYAVIDTDGLVHPFERDLSVRPSDSEIPVQVPPSELGASVGAEPIPVGLVVLTKYEPEARFEPEPTTLGIGIMETIPEVIPIRFNTDFSLKVLNAAFSRAIIIKSLRGEAKLAARSILSFFDDNFNLAK